MIPAIIALIGVLSGALILFTKEGRKGAAVFITNLVSGALDIATPVLHDVAGSLEAIVQAFISAIQSHGGPIAEDLKVPLGDFAKAAFTAAQHSLEGKTDIKPSDWKDIASEAFADAAAFGLGSFVVSAAFEAAFPEKLNTLNSLGPMLATLSGFAEVTEAALRPLFYAGIAQPSRYDANAKFRSMLPDLMHASVMYSRRQIDLPTYQSLLAAAGLSPDYVAAMTAISYRPLQPRALATAIQDTAFPTDTMREILEDNALSPEHVNFYLEVLERNSTRNVRNSYISEALTAYGQGVMSDSELDEVLSSVEWSDTAKQLAKSRALLQRRLLLAKEVEQQITSLVATGGMTPAMGEQQLEAAGVQSWLASLKITLAETKASVAALKRAQSEEHKLEVERQRNNTRTAISRYQAGTIDEEGLTAALALIGLDPTLIASIVSVQSALRAGRMRMVYGQLLSPEDAKVLTDRVSAIESQLKQTLITVDLARAQLASLGVDTKQADALLARWAAVISPTAKAPQLLSPGTGLPPG